MKGRMQEMPAEYFGRMRADVRSLPAVPIVAIEQLTERMQCRRLSGQPAGAPGGLKIVTADRSIQVEQLARQKKTWNPFAAHTPRIDFLQRHAAGCHLGFGEAQRPRHRQT